jgi:hypothetical protein
VEKRELNNNVSKWKSKKLKELGMLDERDTVPYFLGYGVMDEI